MSTATATRCEWVSDDPLYLAYHDEEWGVPLRDELRLFELLVLEGAQAGLSWLTILRKRSRYREVFEGFVPEKVAAWTPRRVQQVLADPGIVRNRAKVHATVQNARAVLKMRYEGGSFVDLLWSFVGGAPQRNRWTAQADVPTTTDASKAMSKALRKRGFKFVGPTICYAFMQATGMVNDHLVRCFRHAMV